MSTGFVGTPWTMMIFFRYCIRYKVDDGPGRMRVLGRLAKKQKVKFTRDVRPMLDGQRVLRITDKGEKQ